MRFACRWAHGSAATISLHIWKNRDNKDSNVKMFEFDPFDDSCRTPLYDFLPSVASLRQLSAKPGMVSAMNRNRCPLSPEYAVSHLPVLVFSIVAFTLEILARSRRTENLSGLQILPRRPKRGIRPTPFQRVIPASLMNIGIEFGSDLMGVTVYRLKIATPMFLQCVGRRQSLT